MLSAVASGPECDYATSATIAVAQQVQNASLTSMAGKNLSNNIKKYGQHGINLLATDKLDNRVGGVVSGKTASLAVGQGSDASVASRSRLATVAQQPCAVNYASILNKFADVFQEPERPPERLIKHKIDLIDPCAQPPRRKIYRMSQPELAECRRQLDKLLCKGWIQPSVSPYGHPVLFARKKDGTLRMCVDYRLLNKNTKVDQFPMPRFEDIIDSLAGATVFSKLDLSQGYHQVAIEPGHEFKTAFTTKWGLFEFTVLPFGLCNAPSTFQRLMQHVVQDNYGKFVLVYLDDILVYSKDSVTHKEHLEWVLGKLREHKLYAKLSKCAFGLQEIEYLGHIVSGKGIKPDPGKVKAVQDWPDPVTVTELQQFLGLANYYNRFVPNFAAVAAPLTGLLQKGTAWVWEEPQVTAFNQLKGLLCSAPVLVLPDFSKPFVLETDASDFAVGAILEQDQGQGLQPVAYYSRKLRGAELNYPTHDRELMAIFLAVKKWRPYLDGKRTVVITDHRPLQYIQTQPNLSRRQTRWLEVLGEYALDLQYRPGKEGVAPDALSRAGRLSTLVSEPGRLNTLVCEPGWLGRVAAGQIECQETLKLRARGLSAVDNQFRVLKRSGLELLYRNSGGKEQLVIPDTHGLRQQLLSELHNTLLSGHLGARKTRGNLLQRVWWPGIDRTVKDFVAGCPVCQRIKDSTSAPAGLLKPLQVPEERFSSWGIDFITHLPIAGGNDTVFTCVDRLTKLVRLTPCKMGGGSMDAVLTARIFFDRIVRDFGVPKEIVSDRDPRWTGQFWRALMAMIGTKLSFSTAFHPQSDGQTERAHRVIEQVLRSYALETGANWSDCLGHCEFALNASISDSTGVSPFEMVYGQPVKQVVDHLDGNHKVFAAQDFVKHAAELVEAAKVNIKRAQTYQATAYNKRHKEVSFDVGHLVLLSTRNLTLSGSRKLNQRWIGPFKITEKVGTNAYRLELPEQYSRMHPVFHVSLLKTYIEPCLGQDQASGLPVLTSEGQSEFEVERILRHKYQGRGAGKRLLYLVKWLGYPLEDATWEPESNVANAPLLVRNYWHAIESSVGLPDQ